MKKSIMVLIICFCFWLWPANLLPVPQNGTDYHEIGSTASFKLPASLKEIGEESFENTAVEIIIIPDGARIIDERAFADNESLKFAYIPESVASICESAFDNNTYLTIIAEKGSYAQTWAENHNIAFTDINTLPAWITKLGRRLSEKLPCLPFIFSLCPCFIPEFVKRKKVWRKSMRPQDRPELYPINYRFP